MVFYKLFSEEHLSVLIKFCSFHLINEQNLLLHIKFTDTYIIGFTWVASSFARKY